MEVAKLSKKAINKAVKVIKEGGVVISPTDTVYGFLADATNKKAVEKIFKIKKRPRSKPLPVFVKDYKMAKDLAKIDKKQEKILKKYWPGKYTFVIKAKLSGEFLGEVGCPPITRLVLGKGNTIGLRIPKYKFLNGLLKKINKPLAQTSANISGKPATTKIKEISDQFEGQKFRPDWIIDAGNLKKSKPSKVIDLTSDKIKILRK